LFRLRGRIHLESVELWRRHREKRELTIRKVGGMMMGDEKPGTIIAVVNQKGGVAKTTTVQHMGYDLVEEYKKRVLLIDSDPQANLTCVFGIEPETLESTMFDVLKGDTALSSIVQTYKHAPVDIAPSNIELSRAEIELVSEINATYLLKQAITPAFLQGPESYDFIIIDCPPSLGILTVNALACADYVLIPIQPEMYALQGLYALESTIDKVRRRANPNLTILGWLITLHDGRTRIHRDVADLFRKRFGSVMFNTIISLNTTIREAQIARKTIFQYDCSRSGAKNYGLLVAEIMARVGG
jgi:chromosome partitioning protein